MIWKFAIRNMMRNKKRTTVSAISVFFAAMLVGVAYGWVNGLLDLYTDGFVKYQTGHVRITTSEFEEREKFLPVDTIVLNSADYIEKIRAFPETSMVEERIRFGILMGRNGTTSQAMGLGMDLEHNSLQLPEKVIEGVIDQNGVVVGHKFARKMNLKIGDQVLLAAKDSWGGFNAIKLPITGITRVGVAAFDNRFIFLDIKKAKTLLKVDEGTTEIYVFGKNIDTTPVLLEKITPLLSSEEVASDYKKQIGGLYATLSVMKQVYLIIEIIILFLASAVIINTMIMAIFERMREIGTMKALGFTEAQLFSAFTIEGAMIGALGGIPGSLIGMLFILFLSYTGVNLENMLGSLEMPIEYIVKPTLGFVDIVIVLTMSTLVPVFASMLPARYIRRYLPSEALRM